MLAKIDPASPPLQLTRRERELKSCWMFAVVAAFLLFLLLFISILSNSSHNHRANLPKANSYPYKHRPATP